MASHTTNLGEEFDAFAAPLVESGRYVDKTEVLHAAMSALRLRLDEKAYDEACERAAEEGEASGIAKGDPFETIRQQYGWRPWSEK